MQLLGGCASRQHPPAPWVTSVQVEGEQASGRGPLRDTGLRFLGAEGGERLDRGLRARSRSASALLRSALAHRETSWWQFLPLFERIRPRVSVDARIVDDDRVRIENFYAERGYFDARVSVSIRAPDVSGPPQRVARLQATRRQIVFQVAEGPASDVRDVRLYGIEALDDALAREVEGVLQVGDGPFTMEAHRATKQALLAVVRRAGHARAQLIAQVNAYPEEGAVDLDYILIPGPRCVFGSVVFEGMENIQESFLRSRIDIAEGAPYDPRVLATNQERLYRLGAFAAVTVLPDLATSGQEIPIRIQLQESRPREMAAGVGFGFESRRWDLQGSFEWSHRNLFQRLIAFRTVSRVGYAILPQFSPGLRVAAADHFPVAEQELELSWPQFPVRTMVSRVLVEAQLGLEQGYKFVSPSLVAGVTWQPRIGVNLDLSYHLEYWNYFQIQPESRGLFCGAASADVTGLTLDSCAGEDGQERSRDPYFLSFLEESLTVDLRDDPVDTTEGFLGTVSMAQAGLGGDYQYFRLNADLRGFLPLVPKRLTLGLRGRVGLVAPFGARAGVPLSARLYAGGAYDLRGWGSRGLPPPGGSANPQATPVGGKLVLLGSVELRARLHRSFSLAGFFDVGRLYESVTAFDAAALQPAAGGGLRVHTPIGAVRLDLAYRLRADAQLAPGSEALSCSSLRNREDVGAATLCTPARLQVYLALNEAF